VKEWFKDYGAAVVLVLFMGLTTGAYWNQTYAYTRAEAQEHGQQWTQQDQRTEFWTGVWENNRSEYEQLFMQFLLIIALGQWFARKQQKDVEEAVRKVLNEREG
jgi:hypothetical protein